MNAPPVIDTSYAAPSYSCESTPISRFAEDYEMPMELAVRLVGPREADTAANIEAMKSYIQHVVRRSREYGYPLTTHRSSDNADEN